MGKFIVKTTLELEQEAKISCNLEDDYFKHASFVNEKTEGFEEKSEDKQNEVLAEMLKNLEDDIENFFDN
ncbi:hypothetical protein ThvES_00002150 [Thiovulum sp. ES]|nr:hypothetical protein ThvES_00002150 [Thiovulum sp. ES]